VRVCCLLAAALPFTFLFLKKSIYLQAKEEELMNEKISNISPSQKYYLPKIL
jgi:hypothetical protein